jgi:tetratricopeptide (TPR) repeat protein
LPRPTTIWEACWPRWAGRRRPSAHFEKALQLKPDYAEAEVNLGNVWFRAGRLAEAINCYQAALRLQPESAGVHYNLGNALLQAGRLREAIAEYEAVLRLNPDDADARRNLLLARQSAADPNP